MILDCMIIDDEPLAHEILESFISRFPDLRLVKKCTDAYSAIDFIYKNPVHLVFLDINMPEVDGITFLKSLKTPPLTIFTTAYREYALDGYDLNIIDFLLKPFSFNRFAMAINKAIDGMGEKGKGNIQNSEEPVSQQNYVFVRSGIKMLKIGLEDILYIEGMKDYLKIYLKNERLVVKGTLKSMEDVLPDESFLRVHKSYIVSKSQIKSVMRDKLEIAHEWIPIGRNYQELVHRYIKSSVG